MNEKTISGLNAELQALKADYYSHKDESNRSRNEIFDKFKGIEKELSNKVSHKTFMLIFTILTGILGFMIWQMNDIREKTTLTAEKVASLDAIFKNAQIEYKP